MFKVLHLFSSRIRDSDQKSRWIYRLTTCSSFIIINVIKSIQNIFQIENASSKKDEILEGRRKKALEGTAEKYKELNKQECNSNLDLDDYCKSKESNGSEKESSKLDIRSGGLA